MTPQPDEPVLVARSNGLVVLKLIGALRVSATRTASAALDAYLDDLEQEGNFDAILIDLTETSSIDSTNLGLLAKAAKISRRRNSRVPTILSTNPDITETLESIGFDRVFDIVRGGNGDDLAYRALPLANGAREHAEIVLDAHRRLLELNEKNRQTFQNVVDLLEARQKKVSGDTE